MVHKTLEEGRCTYITLCYVKGYDYWFLRLEIEALCGGGIVGTERVCLSSFHHTCILDLIFSVEKCAKDLVCFVIDVLVVVVLEVVDLAHTISLLNVSSVNVNTIFITSIFFAHLQYLGKSHKTNITTKQTAQFNTHQ